MKTRSPREGILYPEVQRNVEEVRQWIRSKYALEAGANVDLVCQKLSLARKAENITYVECGVFRGHTLFTVAAFLESIRSSCQCYGFDTFEGFPVRILDKKDGPETFIELFERGEITHEHFLAARDRTHDFRDTAHLSTEYFHDVGRVFEIAQDFKNVHLIKGPFSATTVQFHDPITVLFIDCDLYRSYIDCLSGLYPKVVTGGIVIFDEYYSLKYPGARMAIDEFIAEKPGYFEKYTTAEGFERWCFVKADGDER